MENLRGLSSGRFLVHFVHFSSRKRERRSNPFEQQDPKSGQKSWAAFSTGWRPTRKGSGELPGELISVGDRSLERR